MGFCPIGLSKEKAMKMNKKRRIEKKKEDKKDRPNENPRPKKKEDNNNCNGTPLSNKINSTSTSRR